MSESLSKSLTALKSMVTIECYWVSKHCFATNLIEINWNTFSEKQGITRSQVFGDLFEENILLFVPFGTYSPKASY